MAPRIAALLLVLAAACQDDPPPPSDETTGTTAASDGTSTGMDPGGTSNVTTAPPMTTADPDDTTFGAGCGPDPCPAMCGPDCPSTATCLASVWMCECDCPETGTTGGDACDVLDPTIDAWVAGSELPAVDCGSPGPDDAPFAWETLHDCALIQAMNGMGLRATWTMPEGSEPLEYGVAARVGEVYELAWFERSSTGLVQSSCTALGSLLDCMIGPGSACLVCEGMTVPTAVCEVMP